MIEVNDKNLCDCAKPDFFCAYPIRFYVEIKWPAVICHQEQNYNLFGEGVKSKTRIPFALYVYLDHSHKTPIEKRICLDAAGTITEE